MKIQKIWIVFLFVLFSGCMIPNTYYDPIDPYARGVRWYDRGRYDLAAQNWDPLVAQGDCDAEYWVGVLYFTGQAKPQDNNEAIRLWKKAANANHPKAQAAMGDLYYQNKSYTFHDCADCGIEKDYVQAYVWYKLMEKSARYDGEKKYASEILGKMIEEMNEEQIIKADEIASNWKPTPKDCDPRSWW
jgi:TPR repeat protein